MSGISAQLRNALSFPSLYVRALAAHRYACSKKVPGTAFNRFGRRIGRKLLAKRCGAGLEYLITPVNIVRYFEFPFVESCLPDTALHCLDVGSPRLFSLYVASRRPAADVVMLNPDLADISLTRTIVSHLRLGNIRTEDRGVAALEGGGALFDCIWSISVIEHIRDDDRSAVQRMYNSLKRGGRLILTFPVDRNYWIEYRDKSFYGMENEAEGGRYFFQRFYDRGAIEERILAPIEARAANMRWFGETAPGVYDRYERRWMQEGPRCTVEDPREIADHWCEFPSWESMAGKGVCGLMVEKQ